MSTWIAFAPVEGKFNFGSMSMQPPPMVECSSCAAVIVAGREPQHLSFHATTPPRPAHVGTLSPAQLADLDPHDKQAREAAEQ